MTSLVLLLKRIAATPNIYVLLHLAAKVCCKDASWQLLHKLGKVLRMNCRTLFAYRTATINRCFLLVLPKLGEPPTQNGFLKLGHCRDDAETQLLGSFHLSYSLSMCSRQLALGLLKNMWPWAKTPYP